MTTTWRLAGDPEARRLEARRAFGDEAFTWAQLLSNVVADARACVLFFPSRFDLPSDEACRDQLRTFGANTPARTSVNFWDPRDEQFDSALEVFGLTRPPAVVVTNGAHLTRGAAAGEDAGLYSITFARPDLFTDRERFAAAIETAHHLVVQGDAREIAGFIRGQDRRGLLDAIGRVASEVRDQLVALKPKLGLPGGVSLSLG